MSPDERELLLIELQKNRYAHGSGHGSRYWESVINIFENFLSDMPNPHLEYMKNAIVGSVFCPYCGKEAKFTNGSEIYGSEYKNVMLYVCSQYPKCDSYVGVHSGTRVPKGTMANLQVRAARKKAHDAFDPLWKSKKYTRTRAYKLLANHMQIKIERAHIGMFNEYECEKVVEFVNFLA